MPYNGSPHHKAHLKESVMLHNLPSLTHPLMPFACKGLGLAALQNSIGIASFIKCYYDPTKFIVKVCIWQGARPVQQ